jgi:hypothetical protein
MLFLNLFCYRQKEDATVKKTRDKKAKKALVLNRETVHILGTDPGALLALAVGREGEAPISGGWSPCPTWSETQSA